MIDRESGYYWVFNMLGEWDICYWSSEHKRWCFPNNPIRFHDGVFREIGDKVERSDTAHIKGLLERCLPMLERVKNILYDDNRDNAAIHISNLITEIQNALK